MNIPDFPECQTPTPTVVEEPGFRQANSRTSPLSSREVRIEDEFPFTPGQTSVTSVTSTMQTKTSFRLWVPTEEVQEEQTPQQGIEADDGVPLNRSDSFRNLSTLIAWEKDAEMNLHQGENSLTRQNPQPSITFSVADSEAKLPGTPFSSIEHNKCDPLNKENPYAQSEKSEEAVSEMDEDESVIEDDTEKSEKVSLRKRLLRKLRKFRSRKKDKEQQLKN